MEWIKCSDRMPESSETVSIYLSIDKSVKQARYICGSWYQENDWCSPEYGGAIDSEVFDNITHWQPLPNHPED